jgi:hypothetical protein
MHIDSGSYYRILACVYMGRVDLSIHMLRPKRILRVNLDQLEGIWVYKSSLTW